MELRTDSTGREKPPDTRLGTVIRVGFFIAIVIICLRLVPGLLFMAFGMVVAGTIGTFTTGMAANLLTMRIFDRRSLADIGLGGARGSGRNFALGLILS